MREPSAQGRKWGARSRPVAPQRRRHLHDSHAAFCRLQQHFAGEFESIRLDIHPFERFPRKGSQSALGVTDTGVEEQVHERRQRGRAQVAVLPGHGARTDTAQEPIPHDKIRALMEGPHERGNVRKIVALVGVAHDDETAAGLLDSKPQGAPVPAHGGEDDSRPCFLRDRDRIVRRTVVGDDHFPGNSRGGQRPSAVPCRPPPCALC